MAIREIVWTVADNGKTIHPTAPQDGGVQGEHNATRVVWRVGENSVWETPMFKVYVECEDNAGNVDHTEPLQVEGGQISVLLPQAWTQYGGISTLRLVAEEEGGVVAYLVEGYARFSSRQNASKKVDGLMKGRLAQMEAQMREAVESAEAASERAEVASESAVDAAQSAATFRTGASYFATQAAESGATAVAAMEAAKQSAEKAAESASKAAENAAGGGSNMLVVTFEGSSRDAANYTSGDIYSHVENGGTAVFFDGHHYSNLTMCEPNEAVFCQVWDDNTIYRLVVGADAGFEEQEIYIPQSGGGGITVTDDGKGNVTITASAGVSITDDGQGNVTIV